MASGKTNRRQPRRGGTMTPINCTPDEVSRYYAVRVPQLEQSGAAHWRCPCPIHDGEGNNFSVNPKNGRWRCFSECGVGNILQLEIALTNVDPESAQANILQLLAGEADHQ